MAAMEVVRRVLGERPLYTLYPARHGEPPGPLPEGAELVLSRFAVIHREAGGLLVESPRAWCDLRIRDGAVLAALGALAAPVRPAELRVGLPDDVLDTLITDLWQARLVVVAHGADEDTELRLRQWSPFELWLHNRSRLGEYGGFNSSWGLTAWADGVYPPLPARPAPYPAPPIELHRPDLDALRRTDPSLTAVLEDRRSRRDHDNDRPLTAAALGEFLYRCARVRGVNVLDGIEHVDRPFPSGGALHELEIYPVLRDVDGLEPGMYHYDPHEHQLRLVCPDNDATKAVITGAELATNSSAPQAVLVIAARFGRLLWKYEAMGYPAILKNVGVLFQVMYSVATAMGLAACAIGGGHAELFNQATGRDYCTEGAVGEFLLGSASDRKETHT